MHLNIFLCSNESFRVGTFVTVASLIRHLNSEQETTIHLLSKSFSGRSLEYIESLVLGSGKPIELDFQTVDLDVFSAIHERQCGNNHRWFSEDIYARLLIPTLFPEVEFGIYLDSDFLVQKDLSELLSLSHMETRLFAVGDRTVDCLSHPTDSIDCEKFGLDPTAPYFNSGFLVMNLKRWEREALIPACEAISRQTKVKLPDQSLLNIIFAGHWESIDESWNFMRSPDNWEMAILRNDVNYHFVGPLKPWLWPAQFSLGSFRKVHKYIEAIPPEYIQDLKPIRKPYPLFFAKQHLNRLMGR
ncbi:MAG: hypothetical protein KJT03_02885 [Verrucomicrobiae bacterium]|nr:hypothetical protein [Verrucomicrobiae bacterium]